MKNIFANSCEFLLTEVKLIMKINQIILRIFFSVFLPAASLAGEPLDMATDIDLKNPRTAEVLTILGEAPNDKVSVDVSSGDVNGDGYYDAILGSVGNKLYVIYGSSDLSETATMDLHGIPSEVTCIKGEYPNDGFGIRVSSGDVNGDGYHDIITSALKSGMEGNNDPGTEMIQGNVKIPEQQTGQVGLPIFLFFFTFRVIP